MLLLEFLVTVLYYGLVATMAVVLAREFVRERDWQREVLYLVVLMPLVLRLLRLK